MDYWTSVDELYNTTLSLAFFVLAILMFYIGRKGYKTGNRPGGVSTIISGVCFVIFGYYNSTVRFFVYPYNGFMVWWIGIVLLLNGIFFKIIRIDVNKLNSEGNNPDKKKSIIRRYVETMTSENFYREKITFKMELIRKSFHLTGFLLLIVYFGFYPLYPLTLIISDSVIQLINDIGPLYTLLWGDLSLFPFVRGEFLPIIYLTMMALIGALMFAIISDMIRILWSPEYSVFNFLTRSMLRTKEKNASGPQIYIITGFIFSYMLYMVGLIHILSFFSGVLIACLSDAAAALIGQKYGKHKVVVRSKDTKSIEGFVAGVVVAYIVGFILVGPIYAIIGAVIFFITDYFPIFTADNLLNPIFIPIGIQLFILILGFPVGWWP
jgi:dolichol kinase